MPSFVYYSLSSSEPIKKFIKEAKSQINNLLKEENMPKIIGT